MKVLKLSAHGLPQSWISLQEAALYYAAGSVRWESGSEVACFRGGHNAATGRQSIIRINSIIGTRGNPHRVLPGLSKHKLFARDRHICAYCGGVFEAGDLTREHIVPVAQGGGHHWMNLVTSCRACNHRKGARTPEQARMPLLYAPYVPSLWEDFILRNRRILADQMEFLLLHVPKGSRQALRAAAHQSARRLGDHMAVMDKGAVVHAGPMAQLSADAALQQSPPGLAL